MTCSASTSPRPCWRSPAGRPRRLSSSGPRSSTTHRRRAQRSPPSARCCATRARSRSFTERTRACTCSTSPHRPAPPAGPSTRATAGCCATTRPPPPARSPAASPRSRARARAGAGTTRSTASRSSRPTRSSPRFTRPATTVAASAATAASYAPTPAWPTSKPLAVERRQHEVVVLRRLYLPEHLGHAPFAVADQRRALVAPVGAAVPRLLHPDAVGLGHGVVLVGQQGEAQVVLVRELLDARDGIGRDAEHDRAGGVVVGRVVADPARLGRATRRVGLGIEVDNDLLSAQLRQAHLLAALVRQLEVRRGLTNLDHHHGPFAQEVLREYGPHCHESSAAPLASSACRKSMAASTSRSRRRLSSGERMVAAC